METQRFENINGAVLGLDNVAFGKKKELCFVSQ